jgi:hypothetical protein
MTTADYPDSPTAAGLGGGGVGTSSSTGSTGAKDQAKQAAGTAADEGKHVAGVAQGEAQKVASEAKSQVHGLLDQATSQVEDQSRTQRDRLVETLRSFGDDLEKMAVQSDGPASQVVREVAERARSVSSRMDGREPRELLDDVRSFARRKPGTFLLGALAAGVVAGRLTRGAKDAQSSSGGAAGSYDAAGTGTTYGSPLAADVTSPGAPLSAGAAAPSSGRISDPTTQGHGTAAGTPLAGTGMPENDPVYPTGSEETETGLPNPGGSVSSGATWSDTGSRGDLS